MTGDFRERLRDLAGEMSAVHAPRDLEARVHRRQVGLIAVGLVSVIAVVLIAVAGFRTLDYGEHITPVAPNGFPFPIGETTPVKATKALLQAPEDLMVDPSGNLYIGEWYGNKVDVLAPDGKLATIAGTGAAGYSGDGGPAVSAKIDSPAGMALDA